MAEAAGLAVGVIALVSLFNNAIQCFEFIQLGRGFRKDYQTSQLKLDIARLRLSRWGRSLGLSGDLQHAHSLEDRFGVQTIEQAQALLNQILEMFDEAENLSNKYRGRAKTNNDRLAICNPQTDMNSATADLHNQMRGLSVKRQNRTSLRQKVKWALYEEKSFRRLIEDLTELTHSLVELFPATQVAQQQLCDEELSTIGANDAMPKLREIVAKQDKFLEDAILKVTGGNGVTHSIVFSGANNIGFQLGHNSGTISGFTFGKRD